MPKNSGVFDINIHLGYSYRVNSGFIKTGVARKHSSYNWRNIHAVSSFDSNFCPKVLYHEPVMEPLKVSFKLNKWFAVAWFLPVLLALAAILVEILFPGVSYSSDMAGMMERYRDIMTADQLAEMEKSIQQMPVHPLFLTIVTGMMAGITVNALAAFGEELGWRGFLLREFKALGFTRASLFIGIIWGVWHTPLILQGTTTRSTR